MSSHHCLRAPCRGGSDQRSMCFAWSRSISKQIRAFEIVHLYFIFKLSVSNVVARRPTVSHSASGPVNEDYLTHLDKTKTHRLT